MGVTFSGISSGLDTASIVDSLVAAERSQATALQTKQSDLTTQRSIVNSLSSALAAFGTAAKALNAATAVQPRTTTVSDAKVAVTATAGASPTVHDVRVKSLARGQITGSNTYASNTAGIAGAGTLKITTGATDKTISYDATDTLSTIASKINSAGVGATASVLYDGSSYRLMVAATATGTAAAPTFAETGSGLGLSDSANIKVAATDAEATIDGVTVKRSTNVISDAVDGLSFTLNGTHADADAASSVKVTLDSTALTTKLNALVTAYNSVNSALHVQLDYTGTKKGTNTLFGDSTLRQLQGALGNMMGSSYGSSTLGAIGLTRDKTGGLTLDATKLNDALAKDPDAVAKLFVDGGFSTAVTKMSESYTRASDGILTAKAKSMTTRFSDLQDSIDHINDRADSLKTTLEAQFTALETAMSKLKSQSSYLTSIFG